MYVGRENIINSDVFIKKYLNGSLKSNQICLTFDDGIKSQIDIALPVLQKFKIKAFFFVYSSIFTKKPDLLEINRYFRTTYFKNINEFYKLFFKFFDKKLLDTFFFKNKKNIAQKKKLFPFYTMSHPCGNYNNETLKILDKLNIKIGFKQTLKAKIINKSRFEIARVDHATLLKKV